MATRISKILLATDGSEGSLRAARFAAALAVPLGASITVLTVHDEDALIYNATGPALWPTASPPVMVDLEAMKAATEKYAIDTTLADTQQELGTFKDVDVRQIWGHPARDICEFARTQGCDLIVIGSRGRSAFTELLLGSVSTQVAQHAECPVTIVR